MRAVDYAGPAYRFAASEARLLAAFALPAIAVMAVVGAITSGPSADRMTFALWENLLQGLTTAWFLKPIYLGLLSGQAPAPAELWRFDAVMKAILLNSLLLLCVTDLPLLTVVHAILDTPPSGGAAEPNPELAGLGLIGLVAVPAIVYVSVRLGLVQLIAVEQGGVTLRASWQKTRGRFWLLFRLFVLCIGPSIVLVALLGLMFGGAAERESPFGSAIASALTAAAYLAGQAICAHALVAFYRDLTASTAVAPHSTPGDPAA